MAHAALRKLLAKLLQMPCSKVAGIAILSTAALAYCNTATPVLPHLSRKHVGEIVHVPKLVLVLQLCPQVWKLLLQLVYRVHPHLEHACSELLFAVLAHGCCVHVVANDQLQVTKWQKCI